MLDLAASRELTVILNLHVSHILGAQSSLSSFILDGQIDYFAAHLLRFFVQQNGQTFCWACPVLVNI